MKKSELRQIRMVIDWVMFEEWIKQPKNLINVILVLIYYSAMLWCIAFGSEAFVEGRDNQDYELMMMGTIRFIIGMILALAGWTYCMIDLLGNKIRRLEESQ